MLSATMGALLLSVLTAAHAQQAAPPRPAMPAFRTTPNDTLVSPEVLSDNRVTLRLYAPEAKSVKVRGEWVSDFVEAQKGTDLQADSSGVWSVTVGPVRPGIFRYSFLVDGAEVADPRNPDSSQSLNFTRGMVAVPGLEYQDLGEVPHGAIHIEWYRSKTLGTLRRLHVYTPPGYENGAGKYPVFYLLHGAGDTDDSWSTVGRAGFILDNLIAANRAKPMVVVMPAGHTTRQFTMGGGASSLSGQFEKDFTQDIVPYVESHYRVLTDRQHRAIAGLSMGGMHTLNLAFGNPEQFAYVGVFSSGWFAMGQNAADGPETRYAAALDDARAKQGLKLLWLATGKDDFVLETTRATVATLKRHGFQPEYQETAGSHTWENWRDYLRQFAPRLFQ